MEEEESSTNSRVLFPGCISADQMGNQNVRGNAFKCPSYLSFHHVPWGFHTTLSP